MYMENFHEYTVLCDNDGIISSAVKYVPKDRIMQIYIIIATNFFVFVLLDMFNLAFWDINHLITVVFLYDFVNVFGRLVV